MRILLLLVLSAACSSSSSRVTQPVAESAKSEPDVAAPLPAAVLPEATCEEPLIWLLHHDREEIPAKFCASCGDCKDDDGDGTRETMPWQLLHAAERWHACNDFDYAAALIGAAHGQRVFDPIWQDEIEKLSWYRVNVSAIPLAEAAERNRKWIEGLAARCHANAKDEVNRADWDLVAEWFAKHEAGTTELPDKLFIDGQPASEKAFVQFLGGEGLFEFSRRTPIWYGYSVAASSFEQPTRTITVATGAPGLDCIGMDENCEGFESIDFTFDGDQIVALHVAAAACPFVSVRGEGGWVQQGEILRSLRDPRLQAAQALALPAAPTCSTRVRVRLSEEKSETTFLDAAWLEVGERSLAPSLCAGGARAALCDDDGTFHRLHTGERVDLQFEVPAELACEPKTLWADGYYVIERSSARR